MWKLTNQSIMFIQEGGPKTERFSIEAHDSVRNLIVLLSIKACKHILAET